VTIFCGISSAAGLKSRGEKAQNGQHFSKRWLFARSEAIVACSYVNKRTWSWFEKFVEEGRKDISQFPYLTSQKQARTAITVES